MFSHLQQKAKITYFVNQQSNDNDETTKTTMMMNDSTMMPLPPSLPLLPSLSSKTTSTTAMAKSSSSSSLTVPPTMILSHEDHDHHPAEVCHVPKSQTKVDDTTDNVMVQIESSNNRAKNTRPRVGEMDVICGRGKAGFNHRTFYYTICKLCVTTTYQSFFILISSKNYLFWRPRTHAHSLQL